MINTVTPAQIDSAKRMLLEVRDRYQEPDVFEGLRAALDAIAFLHIGVSMSLRISETDPSLLKEHIHETTRYLNEYFPTWRHSPYINSRYAHAHEGSSYSRLLISQEVYRAHLMRPFLAAYRAVTKLSGSDIKW